MDVKVDAAQEIETPEIDDENDEVLKLPSDDFYLDGWNMSITVDFALVVTSRNGNGNESSKRRLTIRNYERNSSQANGELNYHIHVKMLLVGR